MKAVPIDQGVSGDERRLRRLSRPDEGDKIFGGHPPPPQDIPYEATVREKKDIFHAISMMKVKKELWCMNTVNVLFVHSKCTVCTQYGFEVIKDWFYVIRVFDKDCIDSLNNIECTVKPCYFELHETDKKNLEILSEYNHRISGRDFQVTTINISMVFCYI